MNYLPLNYDQINVMAGTYNPSPVKAYNNATFAFWCRSLFQRACSTIEMTLPDKWSGATRDFFYWCLFRYGFLAVFYDPKYGQTFQPGTLSGINWYYQPTKIIITNPAESVSKELEIGKQCELLKLTPDYFGIWDIVQYYAEKISTLDNAINISLINQKFGLMMAARNKGAASALKKMMDLLNKGEPAVVVDKTLLNDPDDKDSPFQIFERKHSPRESYLTPEQLQDFQTLLNAFDAEIGIPVIPYAKKERMVTSEAQSKIVDSAARSVVWIDTLKSSIAKVKMLYPEIRLDAKLRYSPEERREDDGDSEDNTDWLV